MQTFFSWLLFQPGHWTISYTENDKTLMDDFSGTPEEVTVRILIGEGQQPGEEHHYKNLKEGSFTCDLSYCSSQCYYLKVFINGELKFNKRIRVVKEALRLRCSFCWFHPLRCNWLNLN
jgi:hypothetical protein